MPRAEPRVLLIFLVALRMLKTDAVITGGCTNGVCDVTNTFANLCNTADTPKCICNINYVDTNDACVLIACVAGTDVPADTCGGPNTACNTNSKCACAVHYDTVAATANTCTPIACTSTDATTCLGDNDYCEIHSGTDGTCACKKNFDAVNPIACTRRTCANDEACIADNSACHTVAFTGCGCNTLYTAHANTGACSTQKDCEVETVTEDCGTNTVCVDSGNGLKCSCQSNYKASATGCVQKTCTGNETTNCDADSQCSSDKCVCADNFVINGRVCECPTGFSVVGGVCKKACTATSECGTNGACFKEFCECEPNYAGTAPTTCTQIACSGTTTTTCAADSSCTSSKCVCSAGSFVEGTDKLVCATATAGCEGIFCNFSLLMSSLLMFFFAGKRFE